MATLKELRVEKAQKSEDLAKIFDSVKDMSELSSDQKEEIKRRNQELADLGDSITELQDLEGMKSQNSEMMESSKKVSGMPVYGEPEAEEVKSLGGQFIESDAYKSFVDHGIKNVPFEAKTNVTVSQKCLHGRPDCS